MKTGNEVLQRILLRDLGDRPEGSPPLDTSPIELLHPHFATTWIANGTFEPLEDPEPVRAWYKFTFDDSGHYERLRGREELAAEMLSSAITRGHVRIAEIDQLGVILNPRRQPAPRLSIIDFDELAKYDVCFSIDDGLALLFAPKESASGDYVILEDFYFFWEDILQLRPASTLADVPATPAPDARPTLQHRTQGHLARGNGRRGRKPRRYGAPIASFLARAVREGLQVAEKEKDETLGRWLIEEFQSLGCTDLPDLRNASADARGALAAWLQASSSTEATE